jgi:hypothetical protein
MRRVIRHLLLLFALALGQAVLTVALTVFIFGSGMSRFGSGDPAPASVWAAGILELRRLWLGRTARVR